MRSQLSRKYWVLPVIIVAVVLVAWFGYVACAASDLVSILRGAQALSASPMEADPAEVDALVRDLRLAVVRLDRGLGWMSPILSRLGWLPAIGPLVAQAPSGLELADSLSELGLVLWEDVAPMYAQYRQGANVQSLLPEVLSAVAEDDESKVQLALRSSGACLELDTDALPSRYSGLAAQVCKMMPLLVDTLGAANSFSLLAGVDEPQTYLVLALNEDELRPGGGFITGVGEVQVVGGRVLSMNFRDSYAVDDFSLPYPDPPEALTEFMAVDLLVFRDSNWSPDFPTSAQRAIELYRPGYPVDIAGVISIDQIGVQMVIEAVGPLVLPGASAPVSGSDVIDYIHTAWAPEDGDLDREWWQQRKSFMADVAGAALTRVQSGEVDLSGMAQAVLSAFGQRHLQVYLADEAAASLLAHQDWDGGLVETDGDFLMAVEANLGYNKASTNIARSLSYELDLRQPKPHARVVLGYQHQSHADVACVPEIRYDLEYVDMMDRCYWAYVRLGVPSGALLLSGTETTIPANQLYSGRPWSGDVRITEMGAYDAFGQGFLLPTRGSQSLSFAYQLPARVVRANPDGSHSYHLYVQKQAGVSELDLNVTLHIPENAVLLKLHPDGIVARDGVLFFETKTDTDVEIRVDYRMEKGLDE